VLCIRVVFHVHVHAPVLLWLRLLDIA